MQYSYVNHAVSDLMNDNELNNRDSIKQGELKEHLKKIKFKILFTSESSKENLHDFLKKAFQTAKFSEQMNSGSTFIKLSNSKAIVEVSS